MHLSDVSRIQLSRCLVIAVHRTIVLVEAKAMVSMGRGRS
jgi:hypothetical protein